MSEETYGVMRSSGRRGLTEERIRPASSACSMTSSRSRTSIKDSKGLLSLPPVIIPCFWSFAACTCRLISACPGPVVAFAFLPICTDAAQLPEAVDFRRTPNPIPQPTNFFSLLPSLPEISTNPRTVQFQSLVRKPPSPTKKDYKQPRIKQPWSFQKAWPPPPDEICNSNADAWKNKNSNPKKSRKKGTNYLPNTSKNLHGGFLPAQWMISCGSWKRKKKQPTTFLNKGGFLLPIQKLRTEKEALLFCGIVSRTRKNLLQLGSKLPWQLQ